MVTNITSDIFQVHEALLQTLANTHKLVFLFSCFTGFYIHTILFSYLSPNHAIRSTGGGFNESVA